MFACLLLLLCFAMLAEAVPNGTCVTLGGGYTLEQQWHSFCYDAVKYDYFLPAGKTEDDLNTEAIALYHNTSDPWSGTCKAAIKKLICARVYLKCIPGVDLSDTSTWSNGVYGGTTYPLPYLIPCKSQCTLVRSDCYDMPLYYGVDYSCTAMHNYGGGSVSRYYQAADNSAICFTVTTDVKVAENKEYYRGHGTGGACDEFVDPSYPYIYIPASNIASVGFAPYAGPNVTQTFIEGQIANAFSLLPPSISPDCYVAIKKFICGSYFVGVVEKTLADVMVENGKGGLIASLTFVLNGFAATSHPYINSNYWMNSLNAIPRMPIYEVCTNYSSVCYSFISFAQQYNINYLVPDCEERNLGVVSKFRYFPKGDQEMTRIEMVTPINTLQANSTPNTMSYVDVAAQKAAYAPVASGPTSPGVCKTLNITDPLEQLQYFCHGVVDYYYLLPASMTDAELNARVIEQVSSSFASLPQACQGNLKKLLCSAAYLKCPSGVSLSDPLTWNADLYRGISIPMMRPCVNQCLQTAASCLGLPTLFGAEINCSATFDYTGGLQMAPIPPMYDSANDATCNLITQSVTVQPAFEPYLGNICKGYTTSVFVPPSNTAPLPFAPMTYPYVVQNFIETVMNANPLPRWMEATCYHASRKYLCGSTYLKPDTKTLADILSENYIPAAAQNALSAQIDAAGLSGAALLASEFTLPSYLHYDICMDYSTTCAKFIKLAGPSTPAIVPDCEALATANSSVRKFPNAPSQAITVVESVLLGTNISFIASSNKMSDVNYSAVESFTTTCPGGFSPAYPEWVDRRSGTIEGTGCAVNCITPLFMPEELDYYFTVMQVLISIGFVMNIFTVLIHGKFRDTLDEALILTFFGLSLLNGMWSLVMLSVPIEERYCSNKLNYIDDTDGLTLCAVQSAISSYCLLGMAMLVMFESVNWHSLKVYKVPFIPYQRKKDQIVVALVLPLLTVITIISGRLYGFRRNTFSCMFSQNLDRIGNLDEISFYIPMFIFMVVALVSIARVLVYSTGAGPDYKTIKANSPKCGGSSSNGNNSSSITTMNDTGDNDNGGNDGTQSTGTQALGEGGFTTGTPNQSFMEQWFPLRNDWHVLWAHSSFIAFFGVFWMIGSLVRFAGDKATEEMEEKFFEWAACLFKNFSDDDSYYDICGDHSDGRPSPSLITMTLIVVHAHGFFASLILLPTTLRTFKHCLIDGEKEHIETIAAVLGAEDTASMSPSQPMKHSFKSSTVVPTRTIQVAEGNESKNDGAAPDASQPIAVPQQEVEMV